MSSILKVDTIQTTAGAAPTTKDLGFAAGSVIQVVSARLANNAAVNSTNEVDVKTLSITPKFASSKILLIASWALYLNGGASTERGDVLFKRGSTFVAGTSSSGAGVGYFRDGSGRVKAFTTSANALDSPATTSSTTYTMKYDGYTNNSGGEFTNEGTTMTLMEIAQ